MLSNNNGGVGSNELGGSAGKRLCRRNRVRPRASAGSIQDSLRSRRKTGRAGVRARGHRVLHILVHGGDNGGAELGR